MAIVLIKISVSDLTLKMSNLFSGFKTIVHFTIFLKAFKTFSFFTNNQIEVRWFIIQTHVESSFVLLYKLNLFGELFRRHLVSTIRFEV